jgi:ribosomal protein L19
VFKGLCIARFNKGVRTSFKVYNVFPEVGGFVQHFPL